ncbi:MAG: 50S ribosomal protein L17 [Patescibacteria group bacterium]
MKHCKKKKEFHRTHGQRVALIKGLLSSLIIKEKIRTTKIKAKEAKNLIDGIINKGKEAQVSEKKVSAIREINKRLNAEATKKISGDFVNKFQNRKSGYARVIKLPRRKSDGAEMAIVELIVD